MQQKKKLYCRFRIGVRFLVEKQLTSSFVLNAFRVFFDDTIDQNNDIYCNLHLYKYKRTVLRTRK